MELAGKGLRNKKKHFQHGFTLIEILLSIIILSIILMSLMAFFTQSAKYTEKNGQKLSTMGTAEMVIHMIDANVNMDKLKSGMPGSTSNVSDGTGHNISGPIIDDSEKIISNKLTSDSAYKIGDTDVTDIYYIDGIKSINSKFNITIVTDNFVKLMIFKNPTSQLIQVNVSVKDKSENGNYSETYTYIRR